MQSKLITIAVIFKDNTAVFLSNADEIIEYRNRRDVLAIHTWTENPIVTQEKFFEHMRNLIRPQ